mmetsp:Transcript_11678/g.25333  ORF Transcript_11678/g.25333 Transcript_11678/m.25333 type:complete len:230 (-) Transcript_11678:372-1061(-)
MKSLCVQRRTVSRQHNEGGHGQASSSEYQLATSRRRREHKKEVAGGDRSHHCLVCLCPSLVSVLPLHLASLHCNRRFCCDQQAFPASDPSQVHSPELGYHDTSNLLDHLPVFPHGESHLILMVKHSMRSLMKTQQHSPASNPTSLLLRASIPKASYRFRRIPLYGRPNWFYCPAGTMPFHSGRIISLQELPDLERNQTTLHAIRASQTRKNLLCTQPCQASSKWCSWEG